MAVTPEAGAYRFKVEAYTPETMPMARLAEYMGELAAILGEPKSVHFTAIRPGSLVLAHRIEYEAIPKVRQRVEAVRAGLGPRNARNAYRKVNKFLQEDNTRAVLQEGDEETKILEFPGIAEAKPIFHSVIQRGSIAGTLRRVGGRRDQIRVLLESEGEQIVGCHANKKTAKALAHLLFDPVRLHGQGYWQRDAAGEWALSHFRIDSFDPLETGTLAESLAELRVIATNWDDEPLDEIDLARQELTA